MELINDKMNTDSNEQNEIKPIKSKRKRIKIAPKPVYTSSRPHKDNSY